jgi:hypothetical protein
LHQNDDQKQYSAVNQHQEFYRHYYSPLLIDWAGLLSRRA